MASHSTVDRLCVFLELPCMLEQGDYMYPVCGHLGLWIGSVSIRVWGVMADLVVCREFELKAAYASTGSQEVLQLQGWPG